MSNLYLTFDIVNEYPVYPYFIDFAFVNIKLAVELDGKCHFNNGDERIEHDKIKDAYLVENGWTVFRISYKETNSDTISKFLSVLNVCNPLTPKIMSGVLHKHIGTKRVRRVSSSGKIYYQSKEKDFCVTCGSEIYKNSKTNLCVECLAKTRRKVNRPSIEVLLNDIKEFGYVGTGKKYGVSDNTVRK